MDKSSGSAGPGRPAGADLDATLQRLPVAQADAIRDALSERDALRSACETLLEVERADSLESRLQAVADGVGELGFAAAAVVLVSANGAPEFVVTSNGGSPLLDGLAADAQERSWDSPFDDALPLISLPLGTPASGTLARLVLARDGTSYPRTRAQLVRILGSQALRAISDVRLVEIAERRAARLQRLQEVGAKLGRSLDEREVQREIATQVHRVLVCDGVVIAHPDIERRVVEIGMHMIGRTERAREAVPLDPGVFATVARSGRAMRASAGDAEVDLAAIASQLVGVPSPQVTTVLAVPMLAGIQLVGVIAVYTGGPAPYAEEDEELLSTIASQAASAIVNARLYQESQQERRQGEALAETSRAVSSSLRVAEVLRLVQRHAMALLRARGATVSLRKGDYLHVVAATGVGELMNGTYLPLARSVSGRAVRTRQVVVSNDLMRDPDTNPIARDLVPLDRTVIAPLITEQGAVGALAVLGSDTDFTERDGKTLQRLADQVAVAVVNARLYEEAADATRALAVTFDAIAAGLAVVDADGYVRRCNRRGAELFGVPAGADVAGRAFAALLLGAEDVEAVEPVARALAEAAVARATVRRESDGNVFDVLASPHPEGGAVVSFDDVTSYHALAERHRHLMERATDAIFELDADGRIVSANAATPTLTGLPAEALPGQDLLGLVDPAERGSVRAYLQAVRAGEARVYECRLVRADGSQRVVSASCTALHRGEDVGGVLCIARDVTEERDAATALARSEARYTRVVRSASDAILTVDEEGVLTSVNPALERALGRDGAELLDEQDRPAGWQALVKTLAGERVRGEVRFARSDGTSAVANVVTAPVMDGERVTGAICIARDLTEASRASRIIGKLLRFARQESGQRVLVDVNELVRETLDLCASLLRMQDIDVHVTLDPGNPQVRGDPAQLQQILLNLLGNAGHAVIAGVQQREIFVSTEQDGRLVRVSVRDPGIGIAPRDLEQIFNPFFTTKPPGLGTGLGLSISDRIVREHGGRLVVRSTPGSGSTFIVELPPPEGDS